MSMSPSLNTLSLQKHTISLINSPASYDAAFGNIGWGWLTLGAVLAVRLHFSNSQKKKLQILKVAKFFLFGTSRVHVFWFWTTLTIKLWCSNSAFAAEEDGHIRKRCLTVSERLDVGTNDSEKNIRWFVRKHRDFVQCCRRRITAANYRCTPGSYAACLFAHSQY